VGWALILFGVGFRFFDDGLFMATGLFRWLFILIGLAMIFLRMSMGQNIELNRQILEQNKKIIARLDALTGGNDGA